MEEDGHGHALVFLVERGHRLITDVRRTPLLGRGDEELDRLGANLPGAREDVLGAARRGDVGSDSHGGECTRGHGQVQS